MGAQNAPIFQTASYITFLPMHEIFLFLMPDRSHVVSTACATGLSQRLLASDVANDRIRAALSLKAIEQSDRLSAIVTVLYPDGCTTVIHPLK